MHRFSSIRVRTPRLAVFDLDGTLIDSSLDLCNSVNAMLGHLGRAGLPHAVISSYIGDGAAMLVCRALGGPDVLTAGSHNGRPNGSACGNPDARLLREALDFFIHHYREHKLDNTTLYPDVLPALEEIRRRAPALPMAVLTNKPVGPSRGICDALGVTPFVFRNYGGDSFATKKPDPAGLLALMHEAAVLTQAPPLEAGEVVMVGDSDVDVLTARSCGARSVGCAFGLSPQALALAQPDVTVQSASEWPDTLLGSHR